MGARNKDWARAVFVGYENLLVPSFTPDLRELDEAGIRLDVRQSLRHGFFASQCALAAGLTHEEMLRFISIALDEADSRLQLSVSLSGLPVTEAIRVLAHLEGHGGTHVHLGYPAGFAPRTSAELVDHVRRITRATALGICLVVNDRHAFRHLHPSGVPFDALERLADEDNVVALELATLDTGLILECCERFSDRLLITSPHLAMLPMLRQNFGLQWSGPWGVEALQSPERPHAIDFMLRLRNDELPAAMEIYWRLSPALAAAARLASTYAHTGAQHWPLLKYQQWLSGGNGGMTRQPVMRLFDRDLRSARAGLAAVGVECPDPDTHFFAGRSACGGDCG